jgi:Tol biopolymer transport system component
VGSGGNNEIAVLDMATQAITVLTSDPADDRDPVWSPDGRRIVFASNRSGTYDLWVMNADGSSPAPITSSADDDRFPAWSPDGSTLLFSRESVLGATLAAIDTACLSMPATCEGRVRPITTEHYDRFPAWAPGGGQIAFTTGDYAGDETTTIALMDLDGSNYTVLAGTGTSDSHPVWSPDGLRIAFVSNANRDEDLWIVGRNGDSLVQLTEDAALDVAPSWSPDGSLIVFASDRAGNFDLYLIPTDCDSPEGGCEEGIIQLTTSPTTNSIRLDGLSQPFIASRSVRRW